jgi:hypothetical protein
MPCLGVQSWRGVEMVSTSLVRSQYGRDWGAELPVDRRRSSGGGFMRFLFAICIGIAGTLGWQTYGDQVREMLATAYPQLSWLRVAAAQTVVTTGAAARSTEQMEALAIRLADMRQRVDQLSQQVAAGQDQMSRDLTAKLAVVERDILDKIAAGQPRPEATVRKPATPTQAQTQTQSTLR